MMVSNGAAMHAIMKATQEEAALSRGIALRSQELGEEMKEISEGMKKDSVSMKTIAVLTMFFLPATSLAAILAMPFFSSNPYLADVNKVWIWVVLTVSCTGIAYTFYHLWRKRDENGKTAKSKDIEMTRSMPTVAQLDSGIRQLNTD